MHLIDQSTSADKTSAEHAKEWTALAVVGPVEDPGWLEILPVEDPSGVMDVLLVSVLVNLVTFK